MIIWMLTFIVGLGNFAHCIATSGEIFVTILTHAAPWSAFPRWFGPAVLGNICGGVGMVDHPGIRAGHLREGTR